MEIHRSEGVTESEKILNLLCKRSFFSLWTYPNVYRDQGTKDGKYEGKEVCDALAVFGDHILIFSDKSCTFPDSGSLDVDWARWYKKAIKRSADQLLGAMRWITQHPDRLFIDKDCMEPLPINLPSIENAKFHLIAVARGAGERCKMHYGGSGSLMVFSPQFDNLLHDHGEKLPLFAIGEVALFDGYIHVFDDITTSIVLETLDTAPDLIRYLVEKEKFMKSGRLQNADGEEELLAYYMQSWNEAGELSFFNSVMSNYNIPEIPPKIILAEGGWEELVSDMTWRSLQEWRRPSLYWDNLIELFAFHTLDGSLYKVDDPSPKYQETLLRFLAAEPRYRRRTLAYAILDHIEISSKDENVDFSARIVFSTKSDEPTYVFLVVVRLDGEDLYKYRNRRRLLLINYCAVVKHKYPSNDHIIGLAVEPKYSQERSEDMIYLDAREWTTEMEINAAEAHEKLGILKDISPKTLPTEPRHYIDAKLGADLSNNIISGKPGRNDPCPCGSGIKFKRCHGSMI
ncbi:YecA family protein [Ruminiclostridium cellobioparum]|jgi:hypothetical protein|uniref:YecA family protein n=1 Tax=Ruminiclostridium cellobioparum TaxID=29355 RepID=UPI000687AEAE|nr:SEC-C domain-containing protein [Ruminiclostridium cellobioparum]